MENKPAQNIQDTFLNTVRKDKTPITVYLVSGVKLTGKIRSFDKYSVLLENNSQEQLIFKHAISTVVSNRSVMHSDVPPGGRAPVPGPITGGFADLDRGAAIAGGERSRAGRCRTSRTRRLAGRSWGRSERSWWEWTSGPLPWQPRSPGGRAAGGGVRGAGRR